MDNSQRLATDGTMMAIGKDIPNGLKYNNSQTKTPEGYPNAYFGRKIFCKRGYEGTAMDIDQEKCVPFRYAIYYPDDGHLSVPSSLDSDWEIDSEFSPVSPDMPDSHENEMPGAAPLLMRRGGSRKTKKSRRVKRRNRKSKKHNKKSSKRKSRSTRKTRRHRRRR